LEPFCFLRIDYLETAEFFGGHRKKMNITTNRKGLLPILGFGIATFIIPASAYADGKVLTLSNETTGNKLQVFSVGYNGKLTPTANIPTGGLGTGGGLGSQGAIAVDKDADTIAAVNPGDNTISIFSSRWNHIKLVNRFSSMGFHPASVTLRNNILYVLNQGDATHTSNIQGFRLFGSMATTVAGGISGLSTPNPGPAQISFSPNGQNLVVTEKGTNKIDVFNVNGHGSITGSQFNPAAGVTPFGFAFSPNGYLFVTEAFGGASGASAVSSYSRVAGGLSNISASVPTTQTAACWAVASPNNEWVFAANTGSGTVSTYDISRHGVITLVGNSTAIPGGVSVDLTISGNSRYLYLLDAGGPAVITFAVAEDGRLTRIDTSSIIHGSIGLQFIDQD
jgi:6-phosphogluconolactonase